MSEENYTGSDEPVWFLPFTYMRIGQSFFIPTVQPARLIYVLDTRAKEDGIRIKSFITTEDGYLGVRTWRMG